jgi:cold shock CspA family protein
MIGKVQVYHRDRSWGWIETDPNDPTALDYFVHRTGLVGRKFLRPDDVVEFDPSERNGKPLATKVRVIEDAPAAAKVVRK